MSTTKEKAVKLLLLIMQWASAIPDFNDDYTIKVKKRLKLQEDNDFSRIRSCLDLIEDTELAVLNFCEYGLEKYILNKKHEDIGENYIKLYGVLNAVYLQIHGISELLTAIQTKNKNRIIKSLKNHEINELRNVAGAHTVNYINFASEQKQNKNIDFYKIVRTSLTSKGERIYAVSAFNKSKVYNLYELVMDYNMLSERELYLAIMAYYKSVLPHGHKVIDSLIIEQKLDKLLQFDYRALYKNKIEQSEYVGNVLQAMENDMKAYNLDKEKWIELLKNEMSGSNSERKE